MALYAAIFATITINAHEQIYVVLQSLCRMRQGSGNHIGIGVCICIDTMAVSTLPKHRAVSGNCWSSSASLWRRPEISE